MSQDFVSANDFKERLDQSLRDSVNFPVIRIHRHQHVYLSGDPSANVYFIQSGQVKLRVVSQEGKECLAAIYTRGDTFGELCLAAPGTQRETATAMVESRVKQIPCSKLLSHLARHSLLDGFVKYLASRVGEQQQIIANLITLDSRHRLGETLLLLAEKLGQPRPEGTLIKSQITHEELSEIVGTTRPRITTFLRQFRARGLLDVTSGHQLIVKQERLSDFLQAPS